MISFSIDVWCKEYLSDKDTERFMFFGDSLRNAFMEENNYTLGADGRFK